jgi:HEAT repeat protein
MMSSKAVSIGRNRVGFALVAFCSIFLGCGGDPIGELIAQLDHSDATIRRTAARTLPEQGSADARVVPALTKAVADLDPQVRFESVVALGKLSSASDTARQSLENALKDPDSKVRVRAAFALQKIAPDEQSFVPVIDAAMRSGEGRTILEVGTLGNEASWAVPTLIQLLSHESPQLRAVAAQTLGKVGKGDTKAKAALERASRDSNAAVRGAAIRALKHANATTP